jgi:hypothetical protein
MNTLNQTLPGLGLVGDSSQMDGLFSSIVGGIFGGGGGGSKEKTVVKQPGNKMSGTTIALIAGGALVAGAVLTGVLTIRR